MKKIILALAALVAIGGGATYIVAHDSGSKPAARSQTTQTQTNQSEISYKGVEGKTALELLKQSDKVETKTYSGLGEMVTTINGKTADSKHFWAFYVNGQQAQEGAGTYMTKTGDKIVWKLEEIK